MALPRLHLVELEDLSWFPAPVRRAMTEYLAEVSRRTRPYAPAVPILAELIGTGRHHKVLDLCSGSGGPWPEILAELRASGVEIELELSDRYPNPEALERFGSADGVRYRTTPTAATDVAPGDESCRTIFSGFHHFTPDEARTVLAGAVTAGRPIAIFEATHRSVVAVLAMTLVPIMVLLMTPVIRPFRWSRLLFTYLIPIVPIAAWWDGVVSCLRTWRPDELRAMAGPVGTGDWTWMAGVARIGRGLPVTWLVGTPSIHSGSDGR